MTASRTGTGVWGPLPLIPEPHRETWRNQTRGTVRSLLAELLQEVVHGEALLGLLRLAATRPPAAAAALALPAAAAAALALLALMTLSATTAAAALTLLAARPLLRPRTA